MELRKEILLTSAVAIGILSIWNVANRILNCAKNQKKKKTKNIENALRNSSQRWILAGNVKKLIIYPIKSCNGVEVESAKVTALGLQGIGDDAFLLHDRIFLVVNENYVFQTQRIHPTLVLINVKFNGSSITIFTENLSSSYTFKLPENIPKNRRRCRIWEDFAEGLDCGDGIGKWLDEFLAVKGYRLLYHSKNETQRVLTDKEDLFPIFEDEDKGSFQDETSYMALGQSSIDELNEHLKDPVSHKNFRPNILLENTPEPYSENSWKYIKFGNGENPVILKAAKPCIRCKLTTVNPVTAKFHPDGEPLKTIVQNQQKFDDEEVAKLVKGTGVFGLELGLHNAGNSIIKIGDPVFVALL